MISWAYSLASGGKALSSDNSAEERIAASGLRKPWATAEPISPTTANDSLSIS
jgi:hypothetical protein